MSTNAMTAERFQEGLTLPEYLEHMSMNKERMVRAIDAVTIKPDDGKVLERLGAVRKVLVITEDWCGTSLAYVPFVAKLVEGNADIDLRVFMRDANPDVMDRYLKRGMYRSIPVFVFFDEQMNELARFIEERPA